MYTIIIAFIFSVLPTIEGKLQQYFARVDNLTLLLRKNWTIYHGDYFLSIFNFFVIFTIQFNQQKFTVAIITSLILNLIAHRMWSFENLSGAHKSHLYHKKSSELNNCGKSHFIFSTIELSLIILFLINPIDNIFGLIAGAGLLLFGVLLLVGSYKTNKEIRFVDWVVGVFLIMTVLSKIF